MLENEDVLNVSAALECRVEDSLGGNSFPTAAPFVHGKDDAALAVVKPCGAAAMVIVITSSHPRGHVVATRHCHRAIVVAVGGLWWALEGENGRASVGKEGGESTVTGPQKRKLAEQRTKKMYNVPRASRHKEHSDVVRAAARGT